jgi:hypothetical protein
MTMKETSVAACESRRIDSVIVWSMKARTSAWIRWSGLSVVSPVSGMR